MANDTRVLIFSFAYYPYVGGAEVAIREITDRLPDIDFDLITFKFGNEPAEERMGRVNIHRLSLPTKYLYPITSFFYAIYLNRMHRYNTVWAMMANTGFSALFLRLLFPGIKFVLTIQEGDPVDEIKRRVWFVYPIFRMIFKKADKVTAISNYLADFAREMGAREVEVIPNGVDLKNFYPAGLSLRGDSPVGGATQSQDQGLLRSARNDKEIILVTTSRLVKKNAVDDIIKSLKFLSENIILRVVGSGPDEKMLKDLSEELGLSGRVEFISYAEHNKVAEILRDSHIFVRPSLSEGLGNSFIEAMAVGLPIIGTRVGGIPDFLKEGETGLFCDTRSPEDIARKVEVLLREPGLYAKISKGSKEAAVEGYNWDVIARRFGAIFSVK